MVKAARFEEDGVPDGLDLAGAPAAPAVGVGALRVTVGCEVLVPGVCIGEQMPDDQGGADIAPRLQDMSVVGPVGARVLARAASALTATGGGRLLAAPRAA